VSDPIDGGLLEKAVAGCATAFATLLESHYDTIYRMGWRWLGVREDAEDVAQEVCIKLAGAIGAFRGESDFSTWLHRMTYTVTIDHIRAREWARRFEKPDIVLYQPLTAQPLDPAGADSELWDNVRALPSQQRDAVLLVYGEDLSHAEAAAIMRCAEKTVSWHLHEARKRLRAGLRSLGNHHD